MRRIVMRQKMICGFLDSCNEKLNQEPNNVNVIRTRGILYNLAEKYDKAITDFERIIDEMPSDVSAYYLKGDCHFHKGEFDLAKRDYMRALKLQFDTKITDSSIENAVIIDEQDLKDIEKVLEYEKNQAILNYLPNLIAEGD
ncbi:MAG: tetratricopeptide repeat protein [Bacteroidetes bacterium]|nr:tetratricopeptide repeat protein [Bacteroidota bacterium]